MGSIESQLRLNSRARRLALSHGRFEAKPSPSVPVDPLEAELMQQLSSDSRESAFEARNKAAALSNVRHRCPCA